MSSVWWLTYPQILWNKLMVMGDPSRSTCPLVGPCVLLDITSSSALFPLPSIDKFFQKLSFYSVVHPKWATGAPLRYRISQLKNFVQTTFCGSCKISTEFLFINNIYLRLSHPLGKYISLLEA